MLGLVEFVVALRVDADDGVAQPPRPTQNEPHQNEAALGLADGGRQLLVKIRAALRLAEKRRVGVPVNRAQRHDGGQQRAARREMIRDVLAQGAGGAPCRHVDFGAAEIEGRRRPAEQRAAGQRFGECGEEGRAGGD